MPSSALFILLEYLFGISFALVAIYYIPEIKTDLSGSIIYYFIKIFVAIFIGVAVIGYFHLRKLNLLSRYPEALLLSLAGLTMCIILYAVTSNFLPAYSDMIIPLAGAVVGFNFSANRSYN